VAKFITGKNLKEAVYDIIFKADEKLLILSPYIKLDEYFKKELFKRHVSNANFELIIGFGKNEATPNRSLRAEDFEFFKQFLNVKIVYIANLHAKYYANESSGIITSINLYDYSFKTNIEYGVLFERSFLGVNKTDQEAWEKSWEVLEEGTVVFMKIPQYKKKLLGKDYVGSIIKVDQTEKLIAGKPLQEIGINGEDDEEYVNLSVENDRKSREEFENASSKNVTSAPIFTNKEINSTFKLVSATALGKFHNKPAAAITKFMQSKGLVKGNEITSEGLKLGLTKKTFKGSEYIAYPDNLPFLHEIK
jgi:hypothetical protein